VEQLIDPDRQIRVQEPYADQWQTAQR